MVPAMIALLLDDDDGTFACHVDASL